MVYLLNKSHQAQHSSDESQLYQWMKEMKEGARRHTLTGEHNSRPHTVGRFPQSAFTWKSFYKSRTYFEAHYSKTRNAEQLNVFHCFPYHSRFGFTRPTNWIASFFKFERQRLYSGPQTVGVAIIVAARGPPRDPEIPPTTTQASSVTSCFRTSFNTVVSLILYAISSSCSGLPLCTCTYCLL